MIHRKQHSITHGEILIKIFSNSLFDFHKRPIEALIEDHINEKYVSHKMDKKDQKMSIKFLQDFDKAEAIRYANYNKELSEIGIPTDCLLSISTEERKLSKTVVMGNGELKDEPINLDEAKYARFCETMYKWDGWALFHDSRGLMPKLIKTVRHFSDNGKKIFRIEEGLMDQLLLTKISNVDNYFFRLPYGCIFIDLPFNKTLRIHDSILQSFYVSEEIVDDTKNIDVVCITDDGYNHTYSFSLQNGDVLTQIKQQANVLYSGSKSGIDDSIRLFSFIASIIFYLNSDNSDVVKVLPIVISSKKDSKLPVCYVGKNIIINKNFSGSGEGMTGSERMIHILKWTVRGHFRNQACGEGYKDRKITWIAPHMKGSEKDSPINAKPTSYVVNA